MLKYIIIFCIISFCDSAVRTVGDYDELIFTQRSPATAYRYLQNWSRQGSSSEDVMNYLMEYWRILNPRIWIIRELRSIKYGIGTLTTCKKDDGTSLLYNDAIPEQTTTDELRTKWPAIFTNRINENIWESQYNWYGSCVKPTPTGYFHFAMTLLDNLNIGRIFANFHIFPGRSYDLERMINAIFEELKVIPYIKCEPAEIDKEQNLVEVQLCFNKLHRLKNCEYSTSDLCVLNKEVNYPGSSENQ